MALGDSLRLTVVTPEKPVIDQVVRSVQFPLADGMTGVLPGRAPLIGRLGYDELVFIDDSGESRYFVDGGFVQIAQNVVTILTSSCRPLASLNRNEASKALEAALAQKAVSDSEFSQRQKEQDRARRMLALADQ
ncbi:ATP synthase epsilon chain, sodium ion specific [Planctopirus ephydatiae]|uniref:ATP synthase epsilon chain n=1 Tax=Planctopirus ephydatiae TaxID=2528019 RepID=A0A518GKU7_9PLAN|nr:F0F1 ATP synthase subunit epsilon [Planctopirus ephydatiae]QDV29071.1 ATP synthase epsilon chain, sodium ion specific [Planctopirus ephydatiae]